jgi:DNA-binding NarL/FixJ family response regulator
VVLQPGHGDRRTTTLGVVALLNSDIDAVAMIGRLLKSAGFTVVSALIPDVREGRCDIDAFMTRHDPAVVVYDIGPPYEQNWAMFQQLRATSMRERRFVITSLNPGYVARLAEGDERILEIVDRPFDPDNIVHAVKEAAHARRFIPANANSRQVSNVTTMPDRRFHSDRRQSSWTSNDIYQKLREKREEVEFERRRVGRRATDRDHGPSKHAA